MARQPRQPPPYPVERTDVTLVVTCSVTLCCVLADAVMTAVQCRAANTSRVMFYNLYSVANEGVAPIVNTAMHSMFPVA